MLYTLAPFAIIGVLFFYTVEHGNKITQMSDNPAHTINVVGQQWQWTFNYKDTVDGQEGVWETGTLDKPAELWLPVGESVHFDLTSPDVIHSFWVPSFYFKLDVIPGRTNKLELTPTKTGTFAGKCAELCGLYHSRMIFTVKVVTPDEYQAHLRGPGRQGPDRRGDRWSGRDHHSRPPGARRARSDRLRRAHRRHRCGDRALPRRRSKGQIAVKWLTTTDHKLIGHLYLITSFAFFLIGGVMALLIRAELAKPGLQIVNEEVYNQLFTMHGTIMLLLFATPLFVGFANVIMPVQIGAPDVAFPRLNMFSFWLFLFGGLITISGFFTPGGAADFGWFAYAPLSNAVRSPGIGGDLWIMGLWMAGLGTILGAVNFVTTSSPCARPV